VSDIRWRNHFESRARELGGVPEACDYRDARSFHARRDNLFRWIGGPKGLRILDVGCGPGLFIHPVVADNRVIGVDFSIGMLGMAREHGLIPVNSDAMCLPFQDNTFDMVVCIELLQCVSEYEALVAELARVKRHGGIVVLSTLNAESAVRRLRSYLHSGRGGDLSNKTFVIPEVVHAFERAGMVVFQIMCLYYPFLYGRIMKTVNIVDRLLATSFAVLAR
jgi:ubiquinone/menaquinone biosynthesis C-methylase UbiE